MFSRDVDRQLIFRHQAGPRVGRQDTLCFKRFKLGEREWSTLKRHVGRLLEAQQLELPIAQATTDWLKAIPRKQFAYLQERLHLEDSHAIDPERRSWEDWIDEFEVFRQEQSTDVATDEAVLRDVRKLQRLSIDVPRIDEGCLTDLLADLEESYAYAENTLARIAKNWRLFFEWLRSKGAIKTNPCDALNRTIAPRSKDTVHWEWIDYLVELCTDTEERYWLRLCQWTGCRLREGLALRACDIELDRNRIYIQETKNQRVRVNPVYPAIREHLPELLSGRDPEERILSRITENNCYEWLYGLQTRAGVPRWAPPYNALRATRANHLASDPTITPQQAGMLLGHSPMVARNNYLKVEESLLERLAS